MRNTIPFAQKRMGRAVYITHVYIYTVPFHSSGQRVNGIMDGGGSISQVYAQGITASVRLGSILVLRIYKVSVWLVWSVCRFLQLISLVPTDPHVLQRVGEMYDQEGDRGQAYQYHYEVSYTISSTSLLLHFPPFCFFIATAVL